MHFQRRWKKYLLKYIFKCHYRFTIHLKANSEQEYDEVQSCQNCLNIEVPEVVHKILEIDIMEAKETIQRLEIHTSP